MSAQRQRNIAAPILVLIVVGLVSLAVISSITMYRSIYNESINTMRQQNRALINRIDGWITLKGNLAEYNAMLLRNLNLDQQVVFALLSSITEINKDVSDVYIGFPDGTGFSMMENPLPPGWVAYERPWYIEAVQRPGEVVFTSPYMDIILNQLAFASVRTIGDRDDSLGVVALHVPFTTMADYVEQANEMTDSFSFILDASGNILLHPNPDFIPLDDFTFQNKQEVKDGRYAEMFAIIMEEGFYTGYGSIYIGTALATTGWYVITRVPTSYIMGNVFATLLSIIAKASLAIISLIVTGVALRTIKVKMKREQDVHETNEIFINSSPFIMNIWDENYRLVATSQQSVEVFGLSSQEQYLERFHELSPEYQPCGMRSQEKVVKVVKDAFRDGRAKFEWMHQTLDGEPLPTEITLVRFTRQGKYMVVAYTSDLRPIKAVMERESEAHEMNQIFLHSAPFSFNLWDEDYNLLDVGTQNIEMFGIADKEQYIKHYSDFWPERQPCGTPSREKALAQMAEAFRKGRARFEWTHITKEGELLPVDVTLVRFRHRDKNLLAAYITDLRPIKEAMRKESEADEATQLFFNASPMCIEIWDEKQNMVDCNQQTCDLFNVSSKEEYMERYDEFLPERQPSGSLSKEVIARSLSKALQEGYARREFMHRSEHGEPLPVETIIVRLKLRGKYMLVCYSHDLRPIKAATEKEREAEERIRLLLDATPMSICLYDTNLIPIDCNEEAVRMFGLSDKADFLNKDSLFMPAVQNDGRNSRNMLDSFVRKAFVEGWAKSEYLGEKADGTLFPIETTFVRIKHKKQYAVAEYSRDLTQMKAAMKKEREAEERVKIVLDASPMSCYLLDADRKAIDCNQAAIELFVKKPGEQFVETYPKQKEFERCKLLGCKNCEHSGRNSCATRKHLVKNYRYIFPDYKKNKEQIERSMAECCDKAFKEGIQRFEFLTVSLYGETIPCEVTIVPVKYQEGSGFAVYLRDLREEKRREIAEEESQAKSRFLARMSHEIRTPMNAVLGIAELQLKKENHPPETEDAFSRIYSSSSLLLTIINDILDISKVESGKMEIIPVTYETASLIIDTAQLNLMNIGSKKITFNMTVDEKLPSYLIGDELRIKQILNNILSNAFKYTSEGHISLSIEVEDGSQPDTVVLIIRISDTGQGMTDEDINNLFNAEFTRFNVQSNRSIQGSGLGMSIAHSFIRMMQGEIKVESAPGKGSTFTMRLPQKKRDERVLGREMAESLQKLENVQKFRKRTDKFTLDPMPYGRVLVVDDVDINLYVAEGILTSYEIVVETAESGPEAIAKVKDGNVYDIIFMDHMMPAMNGVEATKILRGMGYDQPIVALTANALKDSAEMFMNNGFSGFISKPIDIGKLNIYLTRFIRDKHLGKAD